MMLLIALIQDAGEAVAEVATAAPAALSLSATELLVPIIVSALVVGIRNVSAKLDGPTAYYFAIGLNIIGQVVAELATGDGGVTAGAIGSAAALGVGTGATVSVGVATAGKRLGAKKIVTPRPTG